MPASTTSLGEDTQTGTLRVNDDGNVRYNGPMPPRGHGMHRYYFWVLALKTDAKLPPGLTLWELLEKVEPDVHGMNRLVGTYQR